MKAKLLLLASGLGVSLSQDAPPILDPSAYSTWQETSTDQLSRKVRDASAGLVFWFNCGTEN
jgi:hypothetical protein